MTRTAVACPEEEPRDAVVLLASSGTTGPVTAATVTSSLTWTSETLEAEQ